MTRNLGPELLLATHNSGKAEEFRALFAGQPFSIVTAADKRLPVPDETEQSFEGNARIKAHAAARLANLPALSDDSGLCIDDLAEAPGVFSADWAEFPDGRDFAKAMARVEAELRSSKVPPPWKARFVCVLALAWPDGTDVLFRGEVEGQIVFPGRGTLGHGYDPIFLPDGSALTFGEMDRWKKNQAGHRGRAVRMFLDYFT